MRIFVTGGSGFIGGHVIERLVQSGHEVLALARSERAAATVRGYGATAVAGELGAMTAEMLAGVGAVIHCAAYVEEWGTKEQFWTANVDGTTNALEAAAAAGVRRFIHVGTEAALFDGKDLVAIDESAPYPARQLYLYSETKAEAERRVLAASKPGFETISLRPRFVWGPRDNSVLPALLEMAKQGRFAWLDGGRARTSTTHVHNLAHAIERALTRGTAGRAYFIADDGERTLREFLAELASTQGVSLGSRNVPRFVARPLARAIEAVWRVLRVKRTPPMTRFTVDMMSSTVTVRTDRARSELDYTPVIEVAAGLRAMRACA